MAAIGSLCLLLLGLALLYSSANNICPRAEAALLPPTSGTEHGEYLGLVQEYILDGEVEKVQASSSARRSLKRESDSDALPTAFTPPSGETDTSPPVAGVQPPPREVHTDYVFEGY